MTGRAGAQRLAGGALAIVSLSLLILLFAARVDTVFNVVAHTEYVEGTTSAGESLTHAIAWHLQSVTLCRGPDDAACNVADLQPNFTGRVMLEDAVDFRAMRVGDGSLRVELMGADGSVRIEPSSGCAGSALCTVRFPVNVIVAGLDKRLLTNATVVLPFIAGRLIVGREPSLTAPAAQPLLRAAEVSMLSKSIVRDRPFFAGSVTLDEGDQFSVEASRQVGVIRADERPLLQVIYRAQADRGHVRKFFVEEIVISASPFDRLRNDPLLAGLGSVLIALIAIYGALRGAGQ